jgi:WD40 repeat protein
VLLALAANNASSTSEARTALFAALARTDSTTTFRTVNSAATTAKFTPDDKNLAVGTDKGDVVFWDYANLRKLAEKKGHAGAVTALEFSPDASLLASGSADGTVVLWDAHTFDKKRILKTEAGAVFDIAFGEDGASVRSISERAATLWRVSDGQQIRVVPVENLTRNRIVLSPDGQEVALAADWVGLWDIDTDKLIAELKPVQNGYVIDVAFSQQEGTITTLDSDGAMTKWDAKTGQKLRKVGDLGSADDKVDAIAVSADGNFLVAAGTEITVWDVSLGTRTVLPVGRLPAACPAISHDGQKLVWCADGAVVIRDRDVIPIHRTLMSKDPQVVQSLAFSPDGNTLASGAAGGKVLMWNVQNGQQTALLQTGGMGVGSIAFSENNKLAAGMRHGLVTVWDTSRPGEKVELPEAGGVIGASVALSRDGTTLAYAINDRITLWDMTKGSALARLENLSTSRAIVFDPTDKILASANSDGSITLWNVAKHDRIAVLRGHQKEKEVMVVSFSPDGKKLASAGRDGAVIIWNVVEKKEVNRFGGLDEIYSLAFSPDNKILAYRSDNNTVVLRDVQSFQKILTISDQNDSVAFSPDGRRLASGGKDSVNLWYIDPELWSERACSSVGRNLTRAEWRLLIGEDHPYQTLCPRYQVTDR